MGIEKNGRIVCGAVTKNTGTCDRCGYVMTPREVNKHNVVHHGVCPKCGGTMRCMRPVRDLTVVCAMHRSQAVAANAAMNSESVKSIHARQRGLASKLPVELQRLFHEAFTDPRLLSLRPEVALFVVRESILAERLNTGESRSLWERLGDVKTMFVSANEAMSDQRRRATTARIDGNEELAAIHDAQFEEAKADMEAALRTMLKLIDKGGETEDAWAELLKHCERTADLKRMQHARLKDLKQLITAEQAFSLVASLVAAVRKKVLDKSIREALEAELANVLRLPGPEELPVRDTHGMVIDATIAAALNASGATSGVAGATSGVVSANRDAGPSGAGGSVESPKPPKSSVAASGTGEKRKRGRPRKNTGDEKS